MSIETVTRPEQAIQSIPQAEGASLTHAIRTRSKNENGKRSHTLSYYPDAESTKPLLRIEGRYSQRTRAFVKEGHINVEGDATEADVFGTATQRLLVDFKGNVGILDAFGKSNITVSHLDHVTVLGDADIKADGDVETASFLDHHFGSITSKGRVKSVVFQEGF